MPRQPQNAYRGRPVGHGFTPPRPPPWSPACHRPPLRRLPPPVFAFRPRRLAFNVFAAVGRSNAQRLDAWRRRLRQRWGGRRGDGRVVMGRQGGRPWAALAAEGAQGVAVSAVRESRLVAPRRGQGAGRVSEPGQGVNRPREGQAHAAAAGPSLPGIAALVACLAAWTVVWPALSLANSSGLCSWTNLASWTVLDDTPTMAAATSAARPL